MSKGGNVGRSTLGRETIFFEDVPEANYAMAMGISADSSSMCQKQNAISKEWETKTHLATMRETYLNILEENKRKIDEEEAQLSSQPVSVTCSDEEDNEVVNKENVFSCDLTEDEKRLISRRVEENKRKLQAIRKLTSVRKIRFIQQKIPKISDEEAEYTLTECDQDEEMALSLLQNYGYLQELRKFIAEGIRAKVGAALPDYEDSGSDKENDDVIVEKKRRKPRKSPIPYVRKGYRRGPRLLLDEAIRQGPSENWSEARQKAYSQIKRNPNAYYYRFNPPSQRQRNGHWTRDEEELFFRRMNEMGVDGQWGIFSMAIPGRVGYQCSNFYRKLVESGRVHDSNYYVDERGKAHYVGKNGRRSSKVDFPRDVEVKIAKNIRMTKRQTRLSVKRRNSDNDYLPSGERKKRRSELAAEDETMSEGEQVESSVFNIDSGESSSSGSEDDPTNPLPGYMDPFTLEPIKKPAISPDRHVLGMATWIRCLNFSEPKRTCPFTKKPLSKRMLVRLTWENIDMYRDTMIL